MRIEARAVLERQAYVIAVPQLTRSNQRVDGLRDACLLQTLQI